MTKPNHDRQRERCSDCGFWAGHGDMSWSEGECRRHAPVAPLLVRLRIDQFEDREKRQWPYTKADDWCGDFARKAQPNEQAPQAGDSE